MTDLKQCSICGTWRHKRVKRCPTCGAETVVPYWLACWGLGLIVAGLIATGLLSGCVSFERNAPILNIEGNQTEVKGLPL
jgi:hypothetical protein